MVVQLKEDLAALLRREFVLDDDLVHMNHAGVAPWPARCAEAVSRFALTNAKRSYAGQFPAWMATEARLRQRIADLLGVSAADQIALVKNTSEGLSQVAQGLRWEPGDRVIALAEEFISNLITWEALTSKGVELIQVTPGAGQTPEDALEIACEHPRTRLLTVSSVQYGTGWRMDLERLGHLCRARNILFCVDAIQSVGALQYDNRRIQADFVVSGAHKWLMSPFGIGFLYVRAERMAELTPLAYGWHTVSDPMKFKGSLADIAPSAQRFEAGTANLAAIMGFDATLSLLEEVGFAAIEARVLANAETLTSRLAAIPGVELVSVPGGRHLSGNVCVVLPGYNLAQVAVELEERHGVLCAARGPSLRFSPHFYQGSAELDRVVDALTAALH